jgi:hypothetical protein
MSNQPMRRVIYGVLKDNQIKNPDILNPECAPRYSKKFLASAYKNMKKKLGYDDFYTLGPLTV